MRHKSTYRGDKRNAVRKARADALKKKRAKKQADLEAKAMEAQAGLRDAVGGNG